MVVSGQGFQKNIIRHMFTDKLLPKTVCEAATASQHT
jgi:hypothetical protein